MDILLAKQDDLSALADIHCQVFVRQQKSKQWMQSNLSAYPMICCYTLQQNNKMIGYILWTQKSGFRPEAVIELTQIAILPVYQGKGYGTVLIVKSINLFAQYLHQQNSTIKHVIVTTRSDNAAQKLYRRTLGAEVEATLSQLYSADEVIMIARDIAQKLDFYASHLETEQKL